MKQLIENFGGQLEEALAISQNHPIAFATASFDQVYVSGLGGSGIGASIVQDYVKDKIDIPFTVNKSYEIHSSVNAKTLFIACSYSGNTEETVAAVKKAIKAKAEIVCVTSGGVLADVAFKNKLNCILIPGGMPPRACLGYSLTQLLHIMHQAKLLKTSVAQLYKGVVGQLVQESPSIHRKAKTIAKKMIGKIPVIYATVGYEGLAIRFRQQINENSKMLAWHNVLPEMTHNEIVGWRAKHDDLCILALKDNKTSKKNEKRLDFLLQTIKKYCKNIHILESQGATYWQQFFYYVHLTDWISWELSLLNHMDASEIGVINSLKSTMGEKKK